MLSQVRFTTCVDVGADSSLTVKVAVLSSVNDKDDVLIEILPYVINSLLTTLTVTLLLDTLGDDKVIYEILSLY